MWSSFIIHRNVTDGNAMIGHKMEAKLFWRPAKSSDGVLLEQRLWTRDTCTPPGILGILTEGTWVVFNIFSNTGQKDSNTLTILKSNMKNVLKWKSLVFIIHDHMQFEIKTKSVLKRSQWNLSVTKVTLTEKVQKRCFRSFRDEGTGWSPEPAQWRRQRKNLCFPGMKPRSFRKVPVASLVSVLTGPSFVL